MIIRCTQKLAERLHTGRLSHTEMPDTRSAWYANLFHALGVQYIILTESQTLVTVVFSGKGIKSADELARAGRAQIKTKFVESGWTELLGTAIDYDEETLELLAAQDRRVLGCMTDLVFAAELAAESGDALDAIMTRLNRNINSYNGNTTAERRIWKLLKENTQ